jgi:hypothetical protein
MNQNKRTWKKKIQKNVGSMLQLSQIPTTLDIQGRDQCHGIPKRTYQRDFIKYKLKKKNTVASSKGKKKYRARQCRICATHKRHSEMRYIANCGMYHCMKFPPTPFCEMLPYCLHAASIKLNFKISLQRANVFSG